MILIRPQKSESNLVRGRIVQKFFVAAFVTAAFSTSALAVPVIDQSNLAVQPVGGQVIADGTGGHIEAPVQSGNFLDISRAQSVTVGTTGQLTAVDLQLTRYFAQNITGGGEFVIANNVTFNSDGSVASGNVLGIFSFAVASLATMPTGGLVNFDTSSLNLFFNAGDQFVLALSSNSGPSLFGWVSGTSPTAPATTLNYLNYAGGTGYVASITSGSEDPNKYQDVGHDYGFRTWMDAGAVPEPATWAMMIGGFALAGGMMRRRAPALATA